MSAGRVYAIRPNSSEAEVVQSSHRARWQLAGARCRCRDEIAKCYILYGGSLALPPRRCAPIVYVAAFLFSLNMRITLRNQDVTQVSAVALV